MHKSQELVDALELLIAPEGIEIYNYRQIL